MSVLTLIRHAQASFGSDDYDRLSDLGREQARLLGDHCAAHNIVFDEVVTGPRRRQIDTAVIVGERLALAGRPWPSPRIEPDFDEYDLHGLIHVIAPTKAALDSEFAAAVERYRIERDPNERPRAFQRMFERLLSYWVEEPKGKIAGVESWPTFVERIERALRRIQAAAGRKRRIAVFSSGGAIGTAMHLVLHAPASTALALSFRLRNTSLSDFVFTVDRMSLDAFNQIAHLSDPAMWTHR